MEYIKVKTLYCDMDGVLADFEGHFKHLFGKDVNEIDDSEMWGLIEKHGKSKFFEELPWMPGGQELWNFITKNFMSVKILTALGKSDRVNKQTSQGKRAWLRHHLPNLADRDIKMVENKRQKQWYSKPGDIIIDDTPVVISDWNAKGGFGILHKNTQDTIKILEKYLYDEIE